KSSSPSSSLLRGLTQPWIQGTSKKTPTGLAPRTPNLSRVQDLLDDTGRGWNRSLVESQFLPEEAEAILKMKGMDPHREDSLQWVGNAKRKFIVADTYKSLIERKWL
ncbi:isoleucine--tRNA ligase, partial [Striga asiatica]